MSHAIREFWPHDLVPSPKNCRPPDDDVSDLVASIQARGLLQPLVGRLLPDDTAEIVAGGRRLKALTILFDDGRLREKARVILVDGDDADAFEMSLTENITRKALHPVIEFEAFASLAEMGKTAQDIAAHFGITVRQVEQRQALGRLHPDVRTAWLAGRIGGETARAFTIAAPADQAGYLAKAVNRWDLDPDTIRRAFSGESVQGDRSLARFVGEEAYRAAGGIMVADLFAEVPVFADGGLLQRLADEKLAAEAERIKAEEGWGEVLFGKAAEKSYEWDRIRKPAVPEGDVAGRMAEIAARLMTITERQEEIEAEFEEFGWDGEGEPPLDLGESVTENASLEAERCALEEELDGFDNERRAWLSLSEGRRAKAVATITIDAQGALTIARGFLKGKAPPKPEKPSGLARPEPAAPAPGEAEAPEPARLSAALLDELALTATRAAAHVLAGEPRIALAAFVATAVCYGTPIRVSNNGRGEGPALPWPVRGHQHSDRDFGEVFRDVLGWEGAALHMQAARVIAHMLDFTSKAIASHNYDSLKPEAVTELRAALPLEAHRAALVQAFDPAQYFSAAPRAEAVAAIAECGDDPAKHAKLKKADLGALASRLAIARAWLPPLLRGEVFEAVAPIADEEPEVEPDAPPAEPESSESAADAALRIWRDEDGPADTGPAGQAADDVEAIPPAEASSAAAFQRYALRNVVALRTLLKRRGVTVPFGSTKAAMIELAVASEAPQAEEAA